MMSARYWYLILAVTFQGTSAYAQTDDPAAPPTADPDAAPAAEAAAPEPAPAAEPAAGEAAAPQTLPAPATGAQPSEPATRPAPPKAVEAAPDSAAATAPYSFPPSPPANANELATPDSFPRFEPSARVITGYERVSNRTRGASGTIAENQRSAFFLKQARVQIEGELTKRIDLEISAELADGYDDLSSSKPRFLRDAFMNLRLKRYFQLAAGHFKRPMSALEHRNSGDLQVSGRGLTNGLIVEDNSWGSRGLGMQLWGKLKALKLDWALGAFNPVWAATESSRPRGADVLGRVAVEPVKDLTIGANGGVKLMRQPPQLEYEDFYAVGGDVELELAGFSLLVDALYAQLLAPPAGVETQTAFGVVGLASYDLPLTQALTLQPVIFGEYLDSSVDHNSSESIRFVGGLNWLIHETLRIMPQVEIIRWLGDPSEFSGSEGSSVYLMLSLAM